MAEKKGTSCQPYSSWIHIPHTFLFLYLVCVLTRACISWHSSLTRHNLQMLDLSTFKPLKVAYCKLAKKTKDMGVAVTKSNFGSILANACEEGVNEDIIKAGFRKSEWVRDHSLIHAYVFPYTYKNILTMFRGVPLLMHGYSFTHAEAFLNLIRALTKYFTYIGLPFWQFAMNCFHIKLKVLALPKTETLQVVLIAFSIEF